MPGRGQGLVAAHPPETPLSPIPTKPNPLTYPLIKTPAATIEFSGFGFGQVIKQCVGVESSHNVLLENDLELNKGYFQKKAPWALGWRSVSGLHCRCPVA